MYGKQDLTGLRDQVEDAKDDLDAQSKMTRRFVWGQLACAFTIAFSAVLNGYDALPNGGNAGIIVVSIILWIVLITVMAVWLSEDYDSDLSSKYRKLKRDLDRRVAAGVESP